jgi:thioredoxin reductase/NAD-dependent dihydropyrimidine dehydrogenase PreA subunit
MDEITLIIGTVLIVATVTPFVIRQRRQEREARRRFEQLKVSGLNVATTMHPHINALNCIGCGSCVEACPEGDVLGVINGKAVLVHGAKCVGHGLCAEACPVGAIEMLMSPPGKSADLPILNSQLETTVPRLYIVGELGGIGLIKNAVTQGATVVDRIAAKGRVNGPLLDLVIVGAGPAGMAAALAAHNLGLKYVALEQGDIGGTILQYPRRKIVMTSPVELPLWGRLKLRETSKEALLEVWKNIIAKTGVKICTQEKVVDIQSVEPKFEVTTVKQKYFARHVVLALGRRGTPRKLGVQGEGSSKVMYRLIDAGSYQRSNVLVVGGGDSAIEAAVGLAAQGTNRVTLSYRKGEFTRIKERNAKHLDEYVGKKKLRVIFNSNVREILPDKVILELPGGPMEIPNECVFIFAGGEMPFEFLKKVGIQFQAQLVS